MPYASEPEMYRPVCEWLSVFLKGRHRLADVNVFDASRSSLAKLIKQNGLDQNLPAEWPSWDIHVDVVGFVITKTQTRLAFVECKNVPIRLAHVSQILIYSKVAKPEYSFVVSPQGASDSLLALLVTFGRIDVLEYYQESGTLPRSVVVARWDEFARSIDYGAMITADANRLGKL